MLANTPRPASPRAIRRTARIPITAANPARTTRMPTTSAVLSLVPNVEMAKSLTGSGVRSMAAWPTARTGEACATVRPATSWPTPIATAAVSTPATAPATALGCGDEPAAPGRPAAGGSALGGPAVVGGRVMADSQVDAATTLPARRPSPAGQLLSSANHQSSKIQRVGEPE